MGTVSDVITEELRVAVQQVTLRARVLNDLPAEEKERYKANIRATNILLQGIPKDIYSLINHYTDTKDIWENVKMILEGSELTKDDRESQLYDEFEHFRQIKGETIQGILRLPEWSRFQTEFKLNKVGRRSVSAVSITIIQSHHPSKEPSLQTTFNWYAQASSNARKQSYGPNGKVVAQDEQVTNVDDNGMSHLRIDLALNVDHVMEDNKQVVQCNVSSIRNDALMSILDEMHEQGVQSRLANKPDMVVNDSVTSELARYKELVGEYEKRAKFELTDRE
ncbi:hypothetical protein Tco_0782732 [Tanacetum coccineum]